MFFTEIEGPEVEKVNLPEVHVGDIKVVLLPDGTFRLDGGAMFGVVPRAIWERYFTPDEGNRIVLGLNPVLIRSGGRNILVETGIGGGGDEKFKEIYSPARERNLATSLRQAGLERSDIDIVINTHLHFDHAGGNTVLSGGVPVPAFPRARYIVQTEELENAKKPNERTRASYRPGDFMPLVEAGLLDLVEGEAEAAPGVRVKKAGGHNEAIQLVSIESGASSALFVSDIIPTAAHARYPFIPAFDLYPLDTLRIKKKILKEAAERDTILFFYHDPALWAGRVRFDEDAPLIERVL